MKTKDLRIMTSIALGTATLTVLAFWPSALEAGNEANVLAAKIAQPKLVANGVELTLAAAEGRALQAGEEPTLELKAVNTTAEPVSLTVRLSMSSSSPQDLLSRRPRMPSILWEQPQAITLIGHETKVIKVPVGVKLPANQMMAVSMQQAENIGNDVQANRAAPSLPRRALTPQVGMVAMTFSTAKPAAQPAPSK
jgi:hypothetical protein